MLSNNPYALHAYASPGVYSVLLRAYNESYPQGIMATVTVHVAAQTIHYVKLGNATPIAPYTSWETAATNIQDALDAANQVGALVLVSNGIYATGGRVVYGAMSNRVAITKPVTVRSVNGPAMTIIQGAGPMGDSAVRCAYVGTNAVLSGFTLTKGHTHGDYRNNRRRGVVREFRCVEQLRPHRQLGFLLRRWGIRRHALQLHAHRQLGFRRRRWGIRRHALQLHAHRQLGFLRRRWDV